MQDKKPDGNCRLVLIGPSESGKSSLVFSWLGRDFTDEYSPTYGAAFRCKDMNIEGNNIKMEIWDLSSDEKYKVTMADYIRKVEAIIGVFDINKPESFEELKILLQNYSGEFGQAHIILVGTKSDVKQTDISENHIKEYAETSNYTYYGLTSARTGENVNGLFDTVARAVFCKIKEPEKIKVADSTELLPLESNRSKNTTNTAREKLIEKLETYIERIGKHTVKDKKTGEIKTNFAYKFWFFKESRAENREANYELAKTLLSKLRNSEDHPNIRGIFSDLDIQRQVEITAILTSRKEKPAPDHIFGKNRGITRSGLKRIIDSARDNFEPIENSNHV